MARKLLDEAGYKDPQNRFPKPLVFRISGSSVAARQYAGVIQNQLKQVGIPVSIEAAETNTHFQELRRGNFQIAYGQWVGGNQDPIFYKDLFATSEIPTEARASKNRSRYSNPALDPLLEEAVTQRHLRDFAVALRKDSGDRQPRRADLPPLVSGEHSHRQEECREHQSRCQWGLGVRQKPDGEIEVSSSEFGIWSLEFGISECGVGNS